MSPTSIFIFVFLLEPEGSFSFAKNEVCNMTISETFREWLLEPMRLDKPIKPSTKGEENNLILRENLSILDLLWLCRRYLDEGG